MALTGFGHESHSDHLVRGADPTDEPTFRGHGPGVAANEHRVPLVRRIASGPGSQPWCRDPATAVTARLEALGASVPLRQRITGPVVAAFTGHHWARLRHVLGARRMQGWFVEQQLFQLSGTAQHHQGDRAWRFPAHLTQCAFPAGLPASVVVRTEVTSAVSEPDVRPRDYQTVGGSRSIREREGDRNIIHAASPFLAFFHRSRFAVAFARASRARAAFLTGQ